MAEEKKGGFFSRLVSGLTKTRDNIVSNIDSVFNGFSNIDEDFYEELEEILIMGDIGVNATNTFIVHGHTPVQSIIDSDDDPKMMFYCGEHKVNIDLGSVWSGIAALVNLDTFDAHYFDPQGEIMHA